jgi:hypothetical protein
MKLPDMASLCHSLSHLSFDALGQLILHSERFEQNWKVFGDFQVVLYWPVFLNRGVLAQKMNGETQITVFSVVDLSR